MQQTDAQQQMMQNTQIMMPVNQNTTMTPMNQNMYTGQTLQTMPDTQAQLNPIPIQQQQITMVPMQQQQVIAQQQQVINQQQMLANIVSQHYDEVSIYVNGGVQANVGGGRGKAIYTGASLASTAENIMMSSGFKVDGIKTKDVHGILCNTTDATVQSRVIIPLSNANPTVSEEKIAESKLVRCIEGLIPKVKGTLNCLILTSLLIAVGAWIQHAYKVIELDKYIPETEQNSDAYYIQRTNENTSDESDITTSIDAIKLMLVVQSVLYTVGFLGYIYVYVANNSYLLLGIQLLYLINLILIYVIFGVGLYVSSELKDDTTFFVLNMLSMIFMQVFTIILPLITQKAKGSMLRLHVITGEMDPTKLY